MAKLKGPLFSLGASGAVGEALVYFPWKGLNVVREYVVPANPKTTAQNTQRGYLTAAVDKIHIAQALAFDPLNETDVMAYSLWGSTYAKPRTWFNQCVKNWIDQRVAVKNATIFCGAVITPGTDKVNLNIIALGDIPSVDDLAIKYGTSKTALVHSQATTLPLLVDGVDVLLLTTGVKYYFQIEVTTPAVQVGNKSGIYYGTPT